MANNLIYFGILAKHNIVNSEKQVAMLSVLIREFETRFQACWGKKKKLIFCYTYDSVFSSYLKNCS